MGNCCPTDNTDQNPGAAANTNAQGGKSPNSKRKGQSADPNPFKQPRGVIVTQNEETGKLQKEKYVPPANPEATKEDTQAQSLVTHSLLTAQGAAKGPTKPVDDVYGGASFQNTAVISKQEGGDALSFNPQANM